MGFDRFGRGKKTTKATNLIPVAKHHLYGQLAEAGEKISRFL